MTSITKIRLYNGLGLALFAGAAALLISALSGCEYQSPKVADVAETAQVNRPVGFDEVNTKVFKVYCLQCHTSRGPELTDYSSAKGASDDIRKAVLVDKTMPKSAPLPADLQALLKAWLDQGAPEQPGDAPSTSNADAKGGSDPSSGDATATVKWTDVSDQVFKKRCTQCHYDGNQDGRVSFSSAQGVRDNVDDVLTMAVEGQMPPEGQEPLSKAQKLMITRWVIDGMLD
jgi:cytochrome c5